MTVTGGSSRAEASAQLVVPRSIPITYCCDKLQCSLLLPPASLKPSLSVASLRRRIRACGRTSAVGQPQNDPLPYDLWRVNAKKTSLRGPSSATSDFTGARRNYENESILRGFLPQSHSWSANRLPRQPPLRGTRQRGQNRQADAPEPLSLCSRQRPQFFHDAGYECLGVAEQHDGIGHVI